MREIVSTQWEHHALIVGVVAILVVVFAPKGLVGLWRDWLDRWSERTTEEPVKAQMRTES